MSSSLVSRKKIFSGCFVLGLYLVTSCNFFNQCRLHSEFYKKKKSGHFVTGTCLTMVILQNRSIASFQAGYFVTGIYLTRVISYYIIDQSRIYKGHFDSGYSDQDCFRRANRLITKVQRVLWFRVFWIRAIMEKNDTKSGRNPLGLFWSPRP